MTGVLEGVAYVGVGEQEEMAVFNASGHFDSPFHVIYRGVGVEAVLHERGGFGLERVEEGLVAPFRAWIGSRICLYSPGLVVEAVEARVVVVE